MVTGVWPAKTGNDLQRIILRSSDTKAISGGGFLPSWCWNRWLVYIWNDIPGWTRPARPDRCKAFATDTHSESRLVMCLFGSYLFKKIIKKKKKACKYLRKSSDYTTETLESISQSPDASSFIIDDYFSSITFDVDSKLVQVDILGDLIN